jgi:hypothetical protein
MGGTASAERGQGDYPGYLRRGYHWVYPGYWDIHAT